MAWRYFFDSCLLYKTAIRLLAVLLSRLVLVFPNIEFRWKCCKTRQRDFRLCKIICEKSEPHPILSLSRSKCAEIWFDKYIYSNGINETNSLCVIHNLILKRHSHKHIHNLYTSILPIFAFQVFVVRFDDFLEISSSKSLFTTDDAMLPLMVMCLSLCVYVFFFSLLLVFGLPFNRYLVEEKTPSKHVSSFICRVILPFIELLALKNDIQGENWSPFLVFSPFPAWQCEWATWSLVAHREWEIRPTTHLT